MALCACLEVLFDIDAGHEVRELHPPGALTPEERADVAYSAFPDSLCMELRSGSAVRDSSFCFRVRRRPRGRGGTPPPHAFLYGHAFCRQRQDDRLRRGCEQKSIVVLSHLPLFALLEQLARLLGPTVMSYGPAALREAFEEVQRWPPLEWGCRLELPLLGMEAVSVELPLLTALPSSALPAAVGASLGLHLAQQPCGLSLDDGGSNSGSGSPSGGGSVDSAGAPGGAAGSVDRLRGDPAASSGHGPAGATAAASPAVAAGCPAAASPGQVAAALAEELDGCDGLPLCLMPQAYGQQELAVSPFGDGDCFTPLRGALQQLWALWELLLLGEPLMVVAPSPGACSGAVTALLSLLAPFPYCQDFRPYLTLHDPAFAQLAAGAAPTPTNGLPLVLGVTNLYFLKARAALPNWPNVLSTGHTADTLPPSSSSERLEQGPGPSGSSSGMRPSESASSVASSSGGGGGGIARRRRRGGGGGGGGLAGLLLRRPASAVSLLSDPVDHCWLAYKPLIRPDKQVIASLLQPQATDSADRWHRLATVNSGMLRRHFQGLTQALLMPLLPYLSPSLPPPPCKQASNSRVAPPDPPPLPPLDAPALLSRLAASDGALPQQLLQRFGGRAGALAFYDRFLRSPNLVAFVQLRRLGAEAWQRQEWAAAAAAVRAPMQELVTVESFFLLEQQLAQAQQRAAGGGGEAAGGDINGGSSEAAALAAQLQQRLQLAFQELPDDLRQAVLQTPCHATLLGLLPQPAQQQAQQQASLQ